MQDNEPKPPPPDPLTDRKTTAPPETDRGLSPRAAALLWGESSPGFPGIRRRYPYSKT
jgi:hypothetical protein